MRPAPAVSQPPQGPRPAQPGLHADQAGTPLLQASHLSFAYGPRLVLQDCSLTVAPGQWIGLLGSNGAGKSTLLRLLAGLLTPSHGQITLAGEPLHRFSRRELARRIGWLPQLPTAPDGLTVLDLVRLGRYPYLGPWRPEGPADHQAVQRALRLAQAEDLAPRLFGELSGGERQRAMLARVLAQEPRLLLLDEPTASLDLRVQLELLHTLSQLVDAGLAVVSALHDLDLAARFCHRLVVLAEGRIVADGPPAQVLTPELLARAFGVEARVGLDPHTGSLHVTPLRALPPAEGAAGASAGGGLAGSAAAR